MPNTINGSSNPSSPNPAAMGTGETPTEKVVDPGKQNALFATIMKSIDEGSCKDSEASSPSTRIITPEEWIHAVKAILEVQPDEALLRNTLLPATISSAVTFKDYDHLRDFNTMSLERLESFQKAAVLVTNPWSEAKKQDLLNCGQGAKNCFGQWLDRKLPLLWKQKPTTAQRDGLLTFFETAGASAPALAKTMERILLSPHFLYNSSLGLSGQLSSWELASSLSETLWDAPLGESLAEMANKDELKSKEQIERQVSKMIADGKFYKGLHRFVKSWLRTEAIEKRAFTESQQISSEAKEQLARESTNYLYTLIREEDDDFSSIFQSEFTVGGDALASKFGFNRMGSNLNLAEISKSAKLSMSDGRKGLLSQPGLIASMSSLEKSNPPRRGQEVMSIFMCQTLVTPPNLADLVAQVGGQFSTDDSVVDAFTKVTSNPACGGCHTSINGIGFGMEEVGPTGLFRKQDDHKKPVVAQGNLVSIKGEKIPYSGIAGLNTALSQSKDAKACLVVQMYRLIHARVENEKDQCAIANVYKKAEEKDFRLSTLFSLILTEKAFLNRKKSGE